MKETAMTAPAFSPLTGALGFYPVVPDADWVQRLLGWGVRTIQLRYKPIADDAAMLAQQVRAAVAAGRSVAGAQVFINDHWRQALAEGAYGVHLGQQDWAALSSAERELLRGSGMRLGLSTHTPEEWALAKSAKPSYLAIGPVYPTSLKVMPYEAVGLERLREWTRQVNPCPVVAIGGISLERLPAVLACGVQGVAVVSAVTQAIDPQRACTAGATLMRLISR
jgi:thiamine-phosphate diphosphorylase